MSDTRDYSDEELLEMEKKEFRKKVPSGWMEVAKNESIVLTIDALLDASPEREYTKEELSEHTGISERSIQNHIEDLVEIGVVEHLEDRTPERYSLNGKSPIIQKIRQLDSIVQRVRDDELAETLDRPLRRVGEHNPTSIMPSDPDYDVGDDVVFNNGDEDDDDGMKTFPQQAASVPP